MALLLAGGAARSFAAEPAPCAKKSVVAGAIRSTVDVEAFVQCAYEYAQEMGVEEARRAFHEDERWKNGQFYIFVDSMDDPEQFISFVFPPDPSREGMPWGDLTDGFGTDLTAEIHRVLGLVDRGWVHYEFRNPESNLTEPKASYMIRIDWNGSDAVIGAGIYRSDFPGTCHPAQVNAEALASEPSLERLEEFVRCAALEVESKGYFATLLMESDPRWSADSIYVFGMDMAGNQLFSGHPVMINGETIMEWGRDPRARFNGRDMIDVAATFGESYIYYHAIHPQTGSWRRKAAFVKRVSGQGVPLLVGAGVYLTDRSAGVARSSGGATIPCAKKSVAAGAIRSTVDVEAFVQCAYEYVQEMGVEEARRAFHEDERWKNGQFYIFVDNMDDPEQFIPFVFPPDPSREEMPWGDLTDGFGTDLNKEFHRVLRLVDRGWVHYEFRNPENNLTEPKAGYAIRIDWNGSDAVIGAGIYRSDFPGTCHPAQVNAEALASEPSLERLEEFVRCAALEVESKGYFATLLMESDPRWSADSIYVFGMDMAGNQLFSGYPVTINGETIMEWGRDPRARFNGRDMIDVAATFGESYIYYHAIHPQTGSWRRKAAFVKRVSGQGVPLLVGAGVYLPD